MFTFELERPLIMFFDDEKISYNDYMRDIRPPIETLTRNNQQVEDCE